MTLKFAVTFLIRSKYHGSVRHSQSHLFSPCCIFLARFFWSHGACGNCLIYFSQKWKKGEGFFWCL